MSFLQSELGEDPVVIEALLKAPVARVYRAWTEPEQIMKWFGPKAGMLISADIDLRVGGAWRFVVGQQENGDRSFLHGTYYIVEPETCLSFSWSHVQEMADGSKEATPESRVTVAFEPHGAATRLQLRHEGIIKRDGRLGVTRGWDTTLVHLKDLVEMA